MVTAQQLAAARLYEAARQGDPRAQFRLAESVASGEFPTQIAPLVRRRLIAVYNETPNLHQNFTQRQTVLRIDTDEQVNVFQFNDQSNIPGQNMGDAFYPGGLPRIGRREKYPTIGLTASGKTIRASKIGEAFNIDWEAIINSRGAEVDLVDQAITAFGRHARQQEDIDVAKKLVTPTGFNTAALPDAKAASGNPDLTDPIKFQSVLNEALTTTIDGVVVSYGDYVLLTSVPYAPYARQMLQQRTVTQVPSRTGTGSDAVGTQYQYQLDFGANIEVVGWKWLSTIWPTIGKGWILLPKAAADDLPILTSNYLQGYETPSFWVKDSNALNYNGQGRGAEVNPLADGDFDSDGIETKVRHVHGANTLWTHGIRYSTGANA